MQTTLHKQTNPITSKYLCKFNGIKDHDFIQIEKDSIINIQKFEELENKIIRLNWKFQLDQIYDETSDFEEIYNNEIKMNNFFNDIYKGLKSTFTFVSNSQDTFFNINDNYFNFLYQSIDDIITSDYSYLPYKYMKNNYRISISFVEIVSSSTGDYKLNDFFNFDNDFGDKNKLKVVEYPDEIVIDGVKEIVISSAEQLEELIKISGQKRNLQMKKNKIKNKQMRHELITVKVYEYKTKNLISKINFLLYKAYEIFSNDSNNLNIINNSPFIINTKENFNFFQTFHHGNFRSCKITRLIKDTLIKNKNITIISLPINLDYIVLIHDILNYIKMRKSSQNIQNENSLKNSLINLTNSTITTKTSNLTYTPDKLSISLINDFNQLNLEDKENLSISSNYKENNSGTYLYHKNTSELNLNRLRKISDKSNIQLLFNNILNN